ncbi:MAG: hypothetical protein V7637_1363, partial [Mycobacteriales bacterium]
MPERRPHAAPADQATAAADSPSVTPAGHPTPADGTPVEAPDRTPDRTPDG